MSDTDTDYVAETLARVLSGATDLGINEGLRLNSAMKSVHTAHASSAVFLRLCARLALHPEMPQMSAQDAPDAKVAADVEYLAGMLAKGLQGAVQFGVSDGLKMQSALRRLRSKGSVHNLAIKTLRMYLAINPAASMLLEAAAVAHPLAAKLIDQWGLRAKEAT